MGFGMISYMRRAYLPHHMFPHGQQGIVKSSIGALLMASFLGYQIVDVTTILLQDCHISGVPILTLQLIYMSKFAAELEI